jgi:hypothetical protein
MAIDLQERHQTTNHKDNLLKWDPLLALLLHPLHRMLRVDLSPIDQLSVLYFFDANVPIVVL